MKHLFLPPSLSASLIEKGFKEECIAVHGKLQYPIDDSGERFAESECIYIPFQDPWDSVKMLWIEKENAHFHWNEGIYEEGDHSRCEIVGNPIPAPLYQQCVDWLDQQYFIYILIDIETTGTDEWVYTYCIVHLPKEFHQAKRRSPHLKTCSSYSEGYGTYTGGYNTRNEALAAAITEALKLI